MVAVDFAPKLWRVNPWRFIAIGCLMLLAVFIFFGAIGYLVKDWSGREEYSHGILIPFMSAFLVWQKKNETARVSFEGSWHGIAVVALGLTLYFLGELATLYIVVQYAFVVVLFGLVLAVMGWRIFRLVWMPLIFLFFAIPLPNFLYQGLSSKLQLVSSQLGVSFIRFCDISVYLEGNVIDLGAMQLQVVEACSGLRYLFPLMSLAFICAYIYKAALWKRAVIFLSSIPITIFMNSFRIGVIGVTVEYFGRGAAEGFLHDFEGWAVFMACTGILVVEMWILARIGKEPRPLADVFGLTFPAPFPPGTEFRERTLPKQFWVVGTLLLAALGLSQSLERREEIIPLRSEFADFPLQIADWTGRRQTMERQYVDALKFDDYILADYVRVPHPNPPPEGAMPLSLAVMPAGNAGIHGHGRCIGRATSLSLDSGNPCRNDEQNLNLTTLPEGEGVKGHALPEGKGAKDGGLSEGNRVELGAPVNFYSAYYANQRKGESIHSPRSCIPGGGWQITSHEVVTMDGVSLHGQPIKLNRLLIQKGESRQLVYYWFQQRGRNLTNEYLVKWFLFQDALVMNRSDGALVRLTTFAPKGEDLAAADKRLTDFLADSLPELDRYIPK